jgi:hypothetical protein
MPASNFRMDVCIPYNKFVRDMLGDPHPGPLLEGEGTKDTRRQEHHVAIRVALNHQTLYRYDRLVTLAPQTIRLRPAPHCRTPILSYSLTIRPAEHFINWQQDPQSNYLARVVFPQQTRELSVEVDLVAEATPKN